MTFLVFGRAGKEKKTGVKKKRLRGGESALKGGSRPLRFARCSRQSRRQESDDETTEGREVSATPEKKIKKVSSEPDVRERGSHETEKEQKISGWGCRNPCPAWKGTALGCVGRWGHNGGKALQSKDPKEGGTRSPVSTTSSPGLERKRVKRKSVGERTQEKVL